MQSAWYIYQDNDVQCASEFMIIIKAQQYVSTQTLYAFEGWSNEKINKTVEQIWERIPNVMLRDSINGLTRESLRQILSTVPDPTEAVIIYVGKVGSRVHGFSLPACRT